MRSKILATALCGLYAVFGLGAAENVLTLGAAAGWEAVDRRSQIDELSTLRPYPVLALSSAWTGTVHTAGAAAASGSTVRDEVMALYGAYRNFPANESALDLALSFDESDPPRYRDGSGRYSVTVSPAVQAAKGRWARYGAGAALFSGVLGRGDPDPVTVRPGRGALFAPGRNIGDFSLEFWLYPNNLENGEQVLEWSADLGTGGSPQRIFCETARNRLRWTFQNFFAAPEAVFVRGSRPLRDSSSALSISLETRAGMVPKTWSHHIIRYSSDTGLLEYLVNGRIENAVHTTASGREGGSVYTPYTGVNGAFVLGSRFSGLIDEFRTYSRAISAPGRTALDTVNRASLELPELAKFPKNGGRVETRALDLGEPGSAILRLEASGGRWKPASPGSGKNFWAGKAGFRFSDDSAVQFFIKAGEEPYRFDRIPWVPVTPGTELSGRLYGRYIQVAAAFYPSGDCETTPYLAELKIVYERNDAPWPPSLVTARALDGAVELNWRPSPDSDTAGYLVYYGRSSGVYYGTGAVLGESPIDAGKRTSLRIEGLDNGTLYFFAVAAYDGGGIRAAELHAGKFSKEVTARPLRMNE